MYSATQPHGSMLSCVRDHIDVRDPHLYNVPSSMVDFADSCFIEETFTGMCIRYVYQKMESDRQAGLHLSVSDRVLLPFQPISFRKRGREKPV